MNKETLEKGNKLQEEITKLQEIINGLKNNNVRIQCYYPEKRRYVTLEENASKECVNEIAKEYEEKLEKLEKEFENL